MSIFGSGTLLVHPKGVPTQPPLGPFPLFPDRCRCWEITSLSTGAKSEFWTLRYAFNCWNLFFAFDFEGMMTWMFGNLKEAKSAKIHTYEVFNQAKWNFELFGVHFGVKMNDYIHLLTTKPHRVDARFFFSESKIFQRCTLEAPTVSSYSYKKNIFSIYLVLKWLGNRTSHHFNPCFVKKLCPRTTTAEHNKRHPDLKAWGKRPGIW